MKHKHREFWWIIGWAISFIGLIIQYLNKNTHETIFAGIVFLFVTIKLNNIQNKEGEKRNSKQHSGKK